MKLSKITVNPSNFDKLRYLFNPGIYIRIFRSSKALSRKINELLDDPDTELLLPEFGGNGEFSIILGDMELWVSNYPCGYGNLYYNPYYVPDLIYLSPDTDRWKLLSSFIMKQQEYRREFGNRLPDRATVFRLRQVVEAAKLLA